MSNKTKKIIMYVVGSIMALAVIMFLMDCIKWTHPTFIEKDFATPSFFDVIFGVNGSRAGGFAFLSMPGMVVLFSLQIAISLGLVVIITFTILKKIDTKVSYLALAICGVLAIVCASLSFASPALVTEVERMTQEGVRLGERASIAGLSALGYGGIVYGSVMMAAGLTSFVPYVLTYCLKK